MKNLIFIIIILNSTLFVYSCPFNGCVETQLDSQSINCVCSSNLVRNPQFSFKYINKMEIFNLNLVPNNSFSQLNIGSLNFKNSTELRVFKDSFRGVKSIYSLYFIDIPGRLTIDTGALTPLSNSTSVFTVRRSKLTIGSTETSSLKRLTNFYLDQSEANILVLTSLPKLIFASFKNSNLKSLALNVLDELLFIELSENKIGTLYLSNLYNMTLAPFMFLNEIDQAYFVNMFKLTQFFPPENLIKSISFVGCNSLNELKLENLGIENVTLTDLTRLIFLTLNNNTVKQLKTSGLNSLIYLSLVNNSLSDIYDILLTLSQSNKLQIIDLSYNYIEDISILSFFPYLTTLVLNDNLISELRENFFSYLFPYLGYLDLSYNIISGQVKIEDASKLVYLDISTNRVDSLILTNLTKLETLNFENNYFNSIFISNCAINSFNLSNTESPVSSLSLIDLGNLNFLNLTNIQILNYNLANLPSLNLVYFINNSLTYFPYSDPLPNLIELFVSNNKLKNISLINYTNLRSLRLDNNQLSSVRLSGLASLRMFIVDKNNLNSLDLSNVSTLVTFSARENKFTDLKSILPAKLNNNLIYFDLSNNLIQDLSILKFYPLISILQLSNNKISQFNETFFNILPNLSFLNVSSNLIKNSIVLKNSRIFVLDFSNNLIPSYQFVNLSQIKILSMNNNPLKSLAISNSDLEELSLTENNTNLLDLNLNNLTRLVSVRILNTNLRTVKLSSLPSLENLDLSNNNLSSLSLPALPNLTSVNLTDNFFHQCRTLLN